MNTHELRFPAQPGPISFDQITDADRVALQHLAGAAQNIVEIGTFLGGSAEIMLEATAGTLVSIDTFDGTVGSHTSVVPADIMKSYATQRLRRFGERVRIVQGTSVEMAKTFQPKTVDLVFLDGAHDYESVKADILAWRPVLKSGGVMAGHDYDRRTTVDLTEEEIKERSHLDWDSESAVHCGVVRAVREMFSGVTMSEDLTSSVWWVQ